MSLANGVATFVGSFIFIFFIRMAWGKMVEVWGPIGGWMAAAFITGTVWTLNHGINTPMIYQTGSAWIDMGMAAGIGGWIATACLGANKRKSIKNVSAAILGGLAGGALLSLFL